MDKMSETMTGLVIRSSWYVLNNIPQLFRGEPRPASYDMYFKDAKDGCAKHDDVWGG